MTPRRYRSAPWVERWLAHEAGSEERAEYARGLADWQEPPTPPDPIKPEPRWNYNRELAYAYLRGRRVGEHKAWLAGAEQRKAAGSARNAASRAATLEAEAAEWRAKGEQAWLHGNPRRAPTTTKVGLKVLPRDRKAWLAGYDGAKLAALRAATKPGGRRS